MFDALRLAIIIPATAALVTGVLFGLLVLALAAWFDWPAIWAAIAGAGAGLLAWLGWSARMAAILEYRLAPGLPKTQATPTQADPQTVNLHIHSEDAGGYIEGAFLDQLPVSESSLAALAGMVLAGGSLTTSQIAASGMLSRPTWEALRDRFVASGLLRWRGGNRQYGVEITHRGMIVFRRLASPYSPPITPDKGD